MPAIVILAKLEIRFRDQEATATYYRRIEPRLQTVDGYEGVGLWQSATNRNEFLALYHYASLEAAEKGLEVVAEERMLAQFVPTQIRPPDVTRMVVAGRLGRREPNAKVGDFLSISDRVADPGMGEDLIEDLRSTFEQIAHIPGFLGAEYGPNDALPDEIVGIVSWVSAEAFYNSVPPGRIHHELSLYQRIV